MGVLSDLVVAPEGDAERVAEAQAPSREFEGIDVKGLDSVKVRTLHSLLTGRHFRELRPDYSPVVTASDEGPWVFLIPHELVSRLATLQDSDRENAAKQWCKSEEFTVDGWREEEVRALLDSICALAQRAVDSGQALFLWMCL